MFILQIYFIKIKFKYKILWKLSIAFLQIWMMLKQNIIKSRIIVYKFCELSALESPLNKTKKIIFIWFPNFLFYTTNELCFNIKRIP